MPFPQCSELTVSVRVAIPDGRYKPADNPSTINPNRIHKRVWLRETARSEPPTATDERIMVRLWVRRDETNPEPIRPMKKPREMKKKSEPASLCPMFRSLSIVGSRGERITRVRKLIKNIAVRKRRKGT